MGKLMFCPVRSKKRNCRSKSWISERVEMTGCPGGGIVAYLNVGRRSCCRGCELASEVGKVEGRAQREVTQLRAIL